MIEVSVSAEIVTTVDVVVEIANVQIVMSNFRKIELVSAEADGAIDTFEFDEVPEVVTIMGIIKEEGVAYTVSGNIVTFLPGFVPFEGDLVRAYANVINS